MDKQEVSQIEADAAYWMELEDLVGWRLFGFSFRDTASYLDKRNASVSLTGRQRDDIVDAIKSRIKPATVYDHYHGGSGYYGDCEACIQESQW